MIPADAQPGDWMVVRTNGWQAWVIRAATASTVNHAAIYLGADRIIQAQPQGVAYGHATDYAGHWQVWSTGHIAYTAAQRDTVVAYAQSMIGTEYGWLDIVAIGLGVLGVRGRWVMERLFDPDSVICSQLVAQASAAAGVRLTAKEPPLVTPGDLLDLIRA